MRLKTAIAATAIAGVAQADVFFIVTEGTFEITARNGDEVEGNLEGSVGTQVGPFNFGTITGEFAGELTAPGPFGGTYTIESADNDGTIVIEFMGTVFGDQTSFSYAADWTLADATGVYDGLVGAGDLSGTNFFTDTDEGLVSLTVQGDLVPAPATLGLLGLGGLVAARRRR